MTRAKKQQVLRAVVAGGLMAAFLLSLGCHITDYPIITDDRGTSRV